MVTKSTLLLIEENYKTQMSLNNIPIPDPMPEMKSIVEEVLSSENCADRRAAQMDLNDILSLLAAFNARDIHFS